MAAHFTAPEVQVWNLSLDVSPKRLRELTETLCHTELERANRFHFERDRDRFIAARGLLRELLSKYIGCAPRSFAFEYGPYGKPAVDGVHFNLSHSGALGVAAISDRYEVGVDIEQVRVLPERDEMARHVFSTAEMDDFLKLDADARQHMFFRIWTRKEAVTKALGMGLSMDFRQVDAVNSMSVHELPMPVGFTGALAIASGGEPCDYTLCGCCR